MDTTQTVGLDTLLNDSSSNINTQYTRTNASNRLSTVSNILFQKFGDSWKIILILAIILMAIAFTVILMLY